MLLCQVFKSPRKEQMYLFVDKENGLEDVPEALLATFGEPESVMLLALKPDRKLARADAREVIDAIEQQGFYLQMPPSEAELREQRNNG